MSLQLPSTVPENPVPAGYCCTSPTKPSPTANKPQPTPNLLATPALLSGERTLTSAKPQRLGTRASGSPPPDSSYLPVGTHLFDPRRGGSLRVNLVSQADIVAGAHRTERPKRLFGSSGAPIPTISTYLLMHIPVLPGCLGIDSNQQVLHVQQPQRRISSSIPKQLPTRPSDMRPG